MSGSERWQSKDSWYDEYGTVAIRRPARDNDSGWGKAQEAAAVADLREKMVQRGWLQSDEIYVVLLIMVNVDRTMNYINL